MAAAAIRLSIAALALVGASCTSVAMEQRSLSDTQWSVVAINGEPAPGSIRFRAGQLSANFGCNRASGAYRVVGDRIEIGPMAATQMACEPATDEPTAHPMRFENMGFSVLNRALNVRWMSGNRVILSNKAGSIELRRTP